MLLVFVFIAVIVVTVPVFAEEPDIPAISTAVIVRDSDQPHPQIQNVVKTAKARTDKETYLNMRAEQAAVLRGWEKDKPFDASLRLKAIRQMQGHFERSALNTAELSSSAWTPIGPAPIPNGQTTGVSRAVSGRVTAIDVHPANPNIAYVGTAQGGVYRTLDGGTTWTAIFDSAQSLAVGAVTIDPLNPSIVFVGTGEGNLSLDSFFGVGLYRIQNADTAPVLYGPFETRVDGTGTAASNGHAFMGTAINKIVVDPADDNRIFVGNTGGGAGISGEWIYGGSAPPTGFIGLYFSRNALAMSPTFSRVNVTSSFNGNQGITDIVFEPGSSDNMIIGVEDFYGGGGLSGIYLTNNASAASQSPSVTPAFTKVVQMGNNINIKFAVNKTGPTVTVLAATGTSSGQLLVSTDGGATFPTTLSAAAGFCGGQCFYDITVAVDPSNANYIYLGGASDNASSRIFTKSTDGGATFNPSSTGLHADSHAIAIAPSNTSIIYTGNDGGVFRSTDRGATWNSLNNGWFNAVQFQSLALHPVDPSFSIGGTQDNGTNWYKPDQTWFRADYGDGGFSAIDQNAADTTNVTMYHTYFNQQYNLIGFARTDSTVTAYDGSWAFYGYGGISNGINSTDKVLFYAPLVLGPGNPNTVYFGTDRLYRSTNKGVTMNIVSQAPIVYNFPISAIGVSLQDDNVRMVGLKNGGVYFTTAGSSTLTSLDPVGTGSVMPDKYVTRTVIDPANRYAAYVTLSGYLGGTAANQSHVWKVTNLNSSPSLTPIGGTSPNNLPDVPVNAFAVDISDPNHPGVSVLYAGTDIGVYQSVDGGANWMPYGSGLPRVAVFDMGIQAAHRILRIATHGRGLWEIDLPGLACANDPVKIGGMPYTSIQTAYNNATAGQIVQLRAVVFTGDLDLANPAAVMLQGGYECDYSAYTDFSAIQGAVTIRGGAITIGNIVIQ